MSLNIYGKIPTQECECPKCGAEFTQFTTVFDMNITHNLKKMAVEAGCGILWDLWDKKAWEIITDVKSAIKNLEENPEKFDAFNAPNGWGTRIQFIPWLKQLLEKLEEFPHAKLLISK